MVQSIEQELKQLEMSSEVAQALITDGDALSRLLDNPDFKLLIMEGYLRDYAVNLVKSKAAIGGQDEKNQMYIANQINTIGHFDQFLRMTHSQAYQARIDLDANAAAREEILEEGN